MIKMIFHQLWNQRRQNGWIFMELLVVSFFLWTVIDPVYVLVANRLIDKGYNSERVYAIRMDIYGKNKAVYDKAMASDSLCKEAYWRMVRIVRSQPEVESYSISGTWAFPNSSSWNGTQVYADTASIGKDNYVHTQWYSFVASEGSDLFRTYDMRDVRTGEVLKIPEDVENSLFMSERAACLLFGSAADAVGKMVYQSNLTKKVAGVFRDYKHRDYEQPYPLIIYMDKDMVGSSYMTWQYAFIIRLKAGVDTDAFEKRFQKEVAPQLSIGNFYLKKLQSFHELSDYYATYSGITNKLRLQYALAGFALLCIFLGMLGTFWIRCNARRQEIGVMRSMGASMNDICRQFLLETWLLVTVAVLVTLPFLLHHAYVNGMYVVEMFRDFVPNPAYWQNRFTPHFYMVLLISYVLLLLVALVGTYIPVNRAIRTLPAEALRDE
ncbi:ABC transporter permease [Bacteroides sp.]|uniref:ABC transporter permease n=1 Tax=Bacteroides sp. TaxID=29523 RepID=UPI0023C10E10|nr:ABC transporter permease [Bacteroides sp.]MDE5759807.1 ABC transporter permease [Bacteroides sp.]MDE6215408.1 ABC transporter permease [Bacteroides sp.]